MVLAMLLLVLAESGCATIPATLPPDDPKPLQQAGDGLWIGGIAFTPADIDMAQAVHDAVTEQWVLDLRFTPAGNAKFIAAQQCGVDYPIEISVDRTVISRPVLRERITGSQAYVSGLWRDRADVDVLVRRITGN